MLREYKNEFQHCLNQSENEIKKLLEAIELRYDERVRDMKSTQRSCENNLTEFKNTCNGEIIKIKVQLRILIRT